MSIWTTDSGFCSHNRPPLVFIWLPSIYPMRCNLSLENNAELTPQIFLTRAISCESFSNALKAACWYLVSEFYPEACWSFEAVEFLQNYSKFRHFNIHLSTFFVRINSNWLTKTRTNYLVSLPIWTTNYFRNPIKRFPESSTHSPLGYGWRTVCSSARVTGDANQMLRVR